MADLPDLPKLKRYFTESRDLTAVARANSLACIDYYDSDQFTPDELATLNARGQPPIVINRIKPAINGIIGVTERGRSDPRAWPRNPTGADSADVATDVLRYIADFNRFRRLKQDVFRDMLVPGAGAALVGVDEDLQVTITQIRWEELFIDPRARRADARDARFIGIAKWMYADDASALWPDKASDIQASVDAGAGLAIAPDESYQDRPLWGTGSTTGAWIDRKQRRLMVIELYYREAGEWRRAVFTGSDILEAGPSPYLDHKGRPDCPIETQAAYVKRDNSRYGAVWDMIGPQDEINKRRSKALFAIAASRIQAANPQAIDVDADVARREAARPDGVIPFGWELVPNQQLITGQLELLQEAKAEIERMGPNPAVIGRSQNDDSGRALLARQQSGLVELASLYGGLEDWELRVYRQCWARAKQYWTAPQWIRVTDDENAPKFVGLNQPILADPGTGAPSPPLIPGRGGPAPGGQAPILGYKNRVAEMDVDIEVDTTPDTATVQQEAFNELMRLVGASPVYQQQISLKQLIMLSPIPHRRSILDALDQASQQQQQQAQQAQAMQLQAAQAKIAETQAKAQGHHAGAFAKVTDALTYAHQAHADHVAAGVEKGIDAGMQQQGMAADAQSQASDQAHQAGMQQQSQDAAMQAQQLAPAQQAAPPQD